MIENKKLRRSLRLSVNLVILGGFLLFPGCDKLGKLKSKMKLLEVDMVMIRELKSDIMEKFDKMADYETRQPRPTVAIQSLQIEIQSEQNTLDNVREVFGEKWEKTLAEFEKLKNVSFSEIITWIRENCPSMEGWINEKFGSIESPLNSIGMGMTNKLDELALIYDEQNSISQYWGGSSPADTNDIVRMAELVANTTSISFDDEVMAMAEISERFNTIGPLQVVAGTTVDQFSFEIVENMPSGFEHLNDGVLAPGTEIIIQLPPSWKLTAPAVIDSNSLMLDIMGNETDSSIIRIEVISELNPGDTNDVIKVTYNGIKIGNRTGLVSSTLTVTPGRSSKQDFVAIPPNCQENVPLMSDLNFDCTVNVTDFAIFANDWLVDVGGP